MTTIQTRASRRFYPELESLRGVAALSVVGLHANLSTGGMPNFETAEGIKQFIARMLTPGNAAVVLFFVLSGFVLAQTIWPGPFDFFKFTVRRLFRLMPAMWAAIAVSVLVNIWLAQPIDWMGVFRATFFADSQINPPLWTLKYEFYLSVLVLPVLALATPRIGVIGNLALQASLFYYFRFSDVIFCAYMFHLGCMVPTIGTWIVKKLQGIIAIIVIGATAAMFLACTLTVSMLGPNYFSYELSLAAPASFLLVSYFASREDALLANFMRSAPMRFLGRISYSIYILHWPIRSVILQFNNTQIGVIVLTMLATISAATICYYVIELPFINIGRRLTQPRSVIDAAVIRSTMAASVAEPS
jgi:peptidoglycan/LPS O-acetylase OafA/YrhL